MLSIVLLTFAARVFDEPSIHSPELANVSSVAFAPSGHWLATGGVDGQVKLWSANSCLGTRELGKHDGEVYAVAFSADGTTLASGDLYKEIEVWDLAPTQDDVAPKHQRTLTANGAVHALAFAPDGKSLFAATHDNAVLVFATTGEAKKDPRVLRHDYEVGALAITADSKRLATGDGGGGVRLFTLPKCEEERAWKRESRVTAVAFSPDGLVVYVGDATPALRAFRTADGTESSDFDPGSIEINAIAVADDGRLYVGTQDGKVLAIDAATGRTVAELAAHDGPVTGVARSPDGRTLVSASRDRTVKVTTLR